MSKKRRENGVRINEELDMRNKKVEAPMANTAVEQEPTIEFDVWWMLRAPSIPSVHKKEVIKADFKGRGLKDEETISTFDKALKAYGL